MRQELAAQRGELAELEGAVGFYRNLMAPDEVDKLVSVGAVEISANNVPGRYHYRIVIQQTAKKHALLRGILTVQIEGLRGEEVVLVDLATLVSEPLAQKIPLQFKYFQSIEGVMDVPADMLPTGVKLAVAITKPKPLELDHQIPWQIEH